MWLEPRYDPTVKDEMGYLSIPPIGAGPNQGGYGLSFHTPSHREPGPDVA